MSSTEISAETRARVLDAAWQRVLEHGPSGVSVKDIAAAAGVSRQLVYFHYGNRAGLLLPQHVQAPSAVLAGRPSEQGAGTGGGGHRRWSIAALGAIVHAR